MAEGALGTEGRLMKKVQGERQGRGGACDEGPRTETPDPGRSLDNVAHFCRRLEVVQS